LCDAPRPDVLLGWYDRHARELPWRVGPTDSRIGQRADPYHVWLSEIMLQQTTVAAVGKYFTQFTELWPTIQDLAGAEDADVMAAWAGLGYYARARNLLKCARKVVADHGGRFPESRDALLRLPGIGPYTASAVAAIAFDQPETVVDGNVERVMSRLFAVETALPASKPELTALAAGLTPKDRPGDYAQAVMDLGATVCTPRNPACGRCPWADACRARKQEIAASLPNKSPKPDKPVRQGIIYLARRSDGAWLLETRPGTGLLGGMLGWPGTDWSVDVPVEAPPLQTDWADPGGEVRHTFTHFHLRLALRTANVGADVVPEVGNFVAEDVFDRENLPTLMRKAYDLAFPFFASD
jgi:A/G-specific adenine glycosylase